MHAGKKVETVYSLKKNVFSYYRMCSLTTECVLLKVETVYSLKPPLSTTLPDKTVSKRTHSIVRGHIL